MKAIFGICFGLLLTNAAWADDSWDGGWKHFGVGVVVGGVGTAVGDRLWPENRFWIGVAAGATAGVLGELVDRGDGWGKWNGKDSTLDALATAAGGVIGAYATDKWILTPVVTRDRRGQAQYRIVAQRRF
jgi:hypothetical protein